MECVSILTLISETLNQCQNLVHLGNRSNKRQAAAFINLTAFEVKEFPEMNLSCVQRLFLSS